MADLLAQSVLWPVAALASWWHALLSGLLAGFYCWALAATGVVTWAVTRGRR